MLDIYYNVCELIENRESFCLATILFKTGSAPRGKGTKMIIRKDFSIIGTIGGGLIEGLTIKSCKDIFENKSSIIKYYNLSNKDASSLGLACGGEIKVLVEYIDGEDPKVAKIYLKAKELKEKSENLVMVKKIADQGEYYNHNNWICTERTFYGEEDNEVQRIFKMIRENFKKLELKIITIGGNKYLTEPVMNYETVYIFGAGHISQKLAQITKMVDFKTVVLDDRAEFANRERFKEVEEIIVTKSFEDIENYVDINNESYIIIVTRGHVNDREVLAQALETEAKYIGMIGSKNKIQFVYDKLREEGYTERDFNRVYSPIGLDIYAETPEEIAVSIAAELIKIRRGPKNGK